MSETAAMSETKTGILNAQINAGINVRNANLTLFIGTQNAAHRTNASTICRFSRRNDPYSDQLCTDLTNQML